MDADTRHQLKTNELGELLERLRDFNSPYVKFPLIAIAVLVVGWIGWASYAYFQRRGAELAWQRLADVERRLDPNDPNFPAAVADLQRLTQDAGNPALLATARIQLARIRYDEAMRSFTEREAKLNDAQSLLLEVRQLLRTPPALDAAAAFALASTFESLAEMGDRTARLEEARKLYEELTTQPHFGGSPFIALAKERLSTLESLKPAIKLTPGEDPAATMPQGPPMPGAAMPGPKLTVDDGVNVQQLTQEEIEQLLGKINPEDLPPDIRPSEGEGAPPPEQNPAPGQPAPAQPAPAQPTPSPAPPAPQPQPTNPPPGGGG